MNAAHRIEEPGLVTRYLIAKVKGGAVASEVAQLVATSCFQLDKTLSPIIGRGGLTALLNRSRHLAGVNQPWLASCTEVFDMNTDLSQFTAALSAQTPQLAALGGGLFLEQFHQLLTVLVGPALTERLVRTVWANFLSGASTPDTAV